MTTPVGTITTQRLSERLREFPLLSGLQSACLDEFRAHASVVRLERGEIVIKRGQHLNGFYGVLNGRLKLYLLSCGGQERVVRLFKSNDCFGEAIMFNDMPSPVFVETIMRTELVFLPRDLVMPVFAKDHDFALAMVRGLGRMLRELLADLESCCLQNARQRVIRYLCNLKPSDPRIDDEVELPASKATVASTLNLSAETFSRELHALEHRGLIRISRRVIHLNDRKRLNDLLELTSDSGESSAPDADSKTKR
jgi:CRP-like cAMP-binding protein